MEKKISSRNQNNVLLTPIRVEMESLKFPIHNLTKKEGIEIDVKGVDKQDREFHWQVSSNAKYGHPGELAYKLDTIIVNRRIESAGTIKPKIIKLGSLRGICRELGINEGKATKNVKNALLQNASAFIRAKFTYRTAEGTEISLEKAFTRYKLVFVGQTLSDGRKANGVFIELDKDYLELVNSANTRPLDYNYLRELTPSAQRFYELVSSKIFPALKHNLPYVKYLYSSFCASAPLTRYFDGDSARKQMYKILKPHKDSGYLEQVEYYELVTNEQFDLVMHLVPGERAKAEYTQFYLKQKAMEAQTLSSGENLLPFFEYDAEVGALEETTPQTPYTPQEEDLVLKDLLGLGIAQKTALQLSVEFRERSQKWVAVAKAGYLPKSVRKIPAYVTKAILEDYGLPQAYIKHKKAKAQPSLFSLPEPKPDKPQPLDLTKSEYEEMCKKLGVKTHGIETLKIG